MFNYKNYRRKQNEYSFKQCSFDERFFHTCRFERNVIYTYEVTSFCSSFMGKIFSVEGLIKNAFCRQFYGKIYL